MFTEDNEEDPDSKEVEREELALAGENDPNLKIREGTIAARARIAERERSSERESALMEEIRKKTGGN